ncbi:hypothetical protein DPR01_30390 [Burkholderia pseudomallei]|nr:hypothetical protein DPR01_30390 [Burkholderia pseudomallei]
MCVGRRASGVGRRASGVGRRASGVGQHRSRCAETQAAKKTDRPRGPFSITRRPRRSPGRADERTPARPSATPRHVTCSRNRP